MLEFIIREIENRDVKKVSKLIQKTYDVTIRNSKTYSNELVNYLIQKYSSDEIKERMKTRKFFVAIYNESIVGIIGLKRDRLSTLYVDPDYLGKGIATKLYERFKEEALSKGISHILVESSEYAKPFYEKMGFKEVKKIDKEIKGEKYQDILMEQKLK